jgi:DNA-binding response OmpR family regulator
MIAAKGDLMAVPAEISSKPQILHVDDDPDIRLLIAASLQDFGYVVATAGTVAEGLDLANEFKFDLCILDVRLPDGNGIDLCQKINGIQPGVPVVYYSVYASDAEQEAALSIAGNAYLKKPVSAAKLEETIAGLLGRTQE